MPQNLILQIRSLLTSLPRSMMLLLPALVPSWRFFDRITASPRIEFTLLPAEDAAPVKWQEFRPRPAQLSPLQYLGRLFFNPIWNENLFLISCAERLMENQTAHSAREIHDRIIRDLTRNSALARETPYLKYRLVFLQRAGSELEKHVTYVSPIHPLSTTGPS